MVWTELGVGIADVAAAKRGDETTSWRGHKGPVVESCKGADVIECSRCGFRHVVPIPSQRQLEKIYGPSYYSVEKPDYIRRHRRDLDWWELVYGERYEAFEGLLPAARRRLLDVGSGPGYFLLHGKHRGWRVVGIEPAKQAAAHSRSLGLDIVEDFLRPQTASKLGTFDVVHLQEVLEHLPNPVALLGLVRDLIEPGGLLSVIVPNDFNPLQEVLRSRLGQSPWWLAPPYHLNYFSVQSLQGLLERCGFEVIGMTATFPMEIFLLMGANYINNDFVGRRVHGMRKALELNLARAEMGGRLRELYEILARHGLGRECVALARRPESTGRESRGERLQR